VRISTKKLRYALELAADVGVATALPMVRLLKRNQEILGRLNDLNVLKRHVAEVQATAPARRPDMTASLDVVGRALEAECRHLHARFLALSPALLESSDICRRTIAPLLAQPPRRRQPALKMSLTAPPVRRPRATHA
jgi:CHAD domain-containing protein